MGSADHGSIRMTPEGEEVIQIAMTYGSPRVHSPYLINPQGREVIKYGEKGHRAARIGKARQTDYIQGGEE